MIQTLMANAADYMHAHVEDHKCILVVLGLLVLVVLGAIALVCQSSFHKSILNMLVCQFDRMENRFCLLCEYILIVIIDMYCLMF